jgi:hypothetical protein
VSDAGPLARLAAILRTDLVLSVLDLTRGRPLAVGWATVEIERAAPELGATLRIPDGRFVGAPECDTLGARCLRAEDALAAGVSLVLLEPSTEGRLAATLAKLDEGPAAVWLAVANLEEAVAGLRSVGIPLA